MKRTFNAGVLIYVLFFMVLYHGYLQKEVPVVSVKCARGADRLEIHAFAPLLAPLSPRRLREAPGAPAQAKRAA